MPLALKAPKLQSYLKILFSVIPRLPICGCLVGGSFFSPEETHRWDPIRCYHSRPEYTLERWQWRGYPPTSFSKAPALLKPHHQIVEFQFRTLVGVVLPLCKQLVSVFCSSSWLSLSSIETWKLQCNIEIRGYTKKREKNNKTLKMLEKLG